MIFSGPLAKVVPLAFVTFLAGTTVSALVVGLLSRFYCNLSGAQDQPAAILATFASGLTSMSVLDEGAAISTMFAVIVYFWREWRRAYFDSIRVFKRIAGRVILATTLTAVIGVAIIKIVERTAFQGVKLAEIENLFGHLEFIAPALAVAGVLILVAGMTEKWRVRPALSEPTDIGIKQAGVIGAIQGLCLPFRGFSRSGATISTAMLMGVAKSRAETFSFALAVVLTPPVVLREVMRLIHSGAIAGTAGLGSGVAVLIVPSLLGSPRWSVERARR
jgi:undecaprenyl-diphosphatase